MMELKLAELTVNCAVALKGPLTPVIVTVPGVLPLVATPVLGSIATTFGFDDDQVVPVVTSRSPPCCPAPRKNASADAYEI